MNIYKAFSEKPSEKFPVLFDHSLLKGVVKDKVISGRVWHIKCGNTMALSASAKGLPRAGGKGDKFNNFFMKKYKDATGDTEFTNGEYYTKKIYDYVDKLRGGEETNYDNNLKINLQIKYLNIINYKKNKPLFENMLKSMKEDNTWKDIVIEICEKAGLNDTEKEEAVEHFNNKIIKAESNDDWKTGGRADKLYQIFFDNKFWGTQKMGGFYISKESPYHCISRNTVNNNGLLSHDTDAITFVLDCIEKDSDVLFLCESIKFNNKKDGEIGNVKSGNPAKCITIEKDPTNGKSYSMIWTPRAGDQEKETYSLDTETKIENTDGFGDYDYAVFNCRGKKVLVIHSDETTPDNWKIFIHNCRNVGIDYIVGDTNQTFKKNGKINPEDFWKDKVHMKSIILPNGKIEKSRIPLNGFLNNQLNKGFMEGDINDLNSNQKVSEMDGMVIINTSEMKDMEERIKDDKQAAHERLEERKKNVRTERLEERKKKREQEERKREQEERKALVGRLVEQGFGDRGGRRKTRRKKRKHKRKTKRKRKTKSKKKKKRKRTRKRRK